MCRNCTYATYVLAGVLCLLVFSLVFVWVDRGSQEAQESERRFITATLGAHGTAYTLEVAETEAQRTQGLSGRTGLEANTGMLFIFETEKKYGFWMKEMLFPLDIMWLDKTMRVVHIAENISPDTFPRVFAPPVPAQYVLEVSAGVASKDGITKGGKLIKEH